MQYFYLIPTSVPNIIKFGGTINIAHRLRSYRTGYGQDRNYLMVREVKNYRLVEKNIRIQFAEYLHDKKKEELKWPWLIGDLINTCNNICEIDADPPKILTNEQLSKEFRDWIIGVKPELYPKDGGIITQTIYKRLLKMCIKELKLQPGDKYGGYKYICTEEPYDKYLSVWSIDELIFNKSPYATEAIRSRTPQLY